ncbi:MAG: hypothetical protein ACRDZ7_19485 [Acidimicrobiia bacterium]
MKPQHRLAALGLAAGLFGGGAAGLALGLPVFAGAQEAPSTTAPDPGPAAPDPGPAAPAKRDRAAWMRDALAPLVEKGTITQEQADAVIAALDAAKPAKGFLHGPKGHGFGRGVLGAGLDVAAKTVGVTPEELRTALRDGKSVADVAKDKGVDPAKVVDALVAEVKTRLDESVAAGRITRAQADEKLPMITEGIRAFVNGEGPIKGRGFFGPGRHGRGPRPDAPPAAPSAFSSGTSTIDA